MLLLLHLLLAVTLFCSIITAVDPCCCAWGPEPGGHRSFPSSICSVFFLGCSCCCCGRRSPSSFHEDNSCSYSVFTRRTLQCFYCCAAASSSFLHAVLVCLQSLSAAVSIVTIIDQHQLFFSSLLWCWDVGWWLLLPFFLLPWLSPFLELLLLLFGSTKHTSGWWWSILVKLA